MKKLSFVPPVSLFAVIIVLSALYSGMKIPQYVKETEFMLGLINGAVLCTLLTAFFYGRQLRKEKIQNRLLKIDVASLESEIRTRNREDKELSRDISDLKTALTSMLDKHDSLKTIYTSEKNKNKKLIEHLKKSRERLRLVDPRRTGTLVVNSEGQMEKQMLQERLAG